MNTRAAPAPAEWPDSWHILGDHGLRSGRYTDPAFNRLEHERLWSRVWQAAARLDEIPEPGDFTTYDIGDQSVMLVRVDADTVKAYHNACPHRGTALTLGCGSFPNEKIICPFHGWRWNLEGANEYVLERHEFRGGDLRDSDVALKEVHSVVFAGFVFINLCRDPQPFDEFIAPVREVLEGLAIEHMRHYWWKQIPAPANWKVAQEAFFETYHVPATHPQLETRAAQVIYEGRPEAEVEFNHKKVIYETFPNGHGRFYAGKNTPMAGKVNQENGGDPVDMMAARLNLLVEGMDAQVLAEDVEVVRSLKGKPIPEGSTLGAEYVKALYARAAEQKRPMPSPTPEILGMWGGEVYIYPNLLILPHAGNAMIYRVRPDGFNPDRSIFEIMSTKTYPADVKPPRATVQKVTELHDPEQVLLIPRQDLGNLERMQKGLHSKGCKQIWLAENHERIIMNMHKELDRYLQKPL
ncbi:MAG TPA: aromatic ring-hydroxylating dioxygenase subunit alpha [Porticoccaceae bacterium]